MSVRHPGCKQLEGPTSGLWSQILWRLMPRKTRQALRVVAAENAQLVKQLEDQQRHFVASRQSICDQWDRWETEAKRLEAERDEHVDHEIEFASQIVDLEHQIKHLDALALPGFTDIVKTQIP